MARFTLKTINRDIINEESVDGTNTFFFGNEIFISTSLGNKENPELLVGSISFSIEEAKILNQHLTQLLSHNYNI